MSTNTKVWIATIGLLLAMASPSAANELVLSMGGGQQLDSDQENKTIGLDYAFYEFKRSARQTLTVGVSYTYLETNFGSNEDLYAISVYPQLALFPDTTSWVSRHVPDGTTPYFFVRALGPTYISEKRFGEREQSEHFTFQAQVGVGVRFDTRSGREGSLSISWKHFSNANLFPDNDGFDLPIVVSFGLRL
ncbi:MAG: acyloxyacyl hydrolase [Gammaproteobacteria bacterium]|nr:acyloxyacyl hydrolase [Gammaproteobacteria bacterium]